MSKRNEVSSWKEAYETVIAANVLGTSKRQRDLLAYLLEHNARELNHPISAYGIAIDVFGRPKDFDPQIDSIVRAEMSRLRKNLTVFNGDDHGFHISLPLGSFHIQVTQGDSKTHFKSIINKFIIGGIAVVFGGLLLLVFQTKSNGNLRPIDETFKITYYIEVDEKNARERLKPGMAKLESELHALAERDNWASPSTQSNQDYRIKFSIDDALLCALIYTKGGKLIWSKKYTLAGKNTDLISDILIREIHFDIFDTLGFLSLYHATNTEISETRQYLFKCVFFALTHTMKDAPKYFNKSPLECLRPELTHLVEEKSLIHLRRANVYSQAHVGGIKIDVSNPLQLAQHELKTAEELAFKTLRHHMMDTQIETYKRPLDTSALNESIGELLDDFSNNLNAQFYGAYIYGVFLGDWKKAIFYADMLSVGVSHKPSNVHLIYAMHSLILNDQDQALKHYNLVSPTISKFAASYNIALSCHLKPTDDLSDTINMAKSQDMETKEKYIDYVKFRNFHTSVSGVYLDKKVLKDCPVFSN